MNLVEVRSKKQKEYYELCRKYGQDLGVQDTEIIQSAYEIEPTGDVHKDKYLNMKRTNRSLYPYKLVKSSSTVACCGFNRDLVEMGISQPLIFSTIVKKVIVFEPDPKNIQYLKEYMERHGIKNIEIIPEAVWNEDVELDFVALDRPAGSFVGKTNKEKFKLKVQGTRVDSKLTEVDMLHITVNGCERQVVEGASNILDNIGIVSVAVIRSNHGMYKNRAEAVDLLKQNGFTVGWAEASPRPWGKNKFWFATAVKDESKLTKKGFKYISDFKI